MSAMLSKVDRYTFSDGTPGYRIEVEGDAAWVDRWMRAARVDAIIAQMCARYSHTELSDSRYTVAVAVDGPEPDEIVRDDGALGQHLDQAS